MSEDMQTGPEGHDAAPMSDEARVLREVFERSMSFSLAEKIETAGFNEFQKENYNAMAEQLAGTFFSWGPGGSKAFTREGYQVATIDTDGTCRVFDYRGLVESVGVEKDALGTFLQEAGYALAPETLGKPGRPRKGRAEFIEELYHIQ